MPTPQDVTILLNAAGSGDQMAAGQLVELVYSELRALAGSYSKGQNPGHTLTPTAIVHEAFVKLVDQSNHKWNDRAHFFAVAATAMRQILVDHARRARAAKRGGDDWQRVSLGGVGSAADEVDLVALDDALTKLASLDARKHRVVELRFFGGLEMEDIARLLDVSLSTVEADWRGARAWLSRELSAAS
jgi:RNA polymerase sigma factor (TIGR02999 family)